ncbi:hypothetical protein KIF59_21815 [Enterobacter cloacae subsp. cloacae]|nr:hypothetical protein [Enterobacter cloacae subsp. cloacae]
MRSVSICWFRQLSPRVNTPLRQTEFLSIMPDINDRSQRADGCHVSGAMAAVVGFQSPYNDQRSVIACSQTARVATNCSTVR